MILIFLKISGAISCQNGATSTACTSPSIGSLTGSSPFRINLNSASGLFFHALLVSMKQDRSSSRSRRIQSRRLQFRLIRGQDCCFGTYRRSANDQTCTVITLGNRDVGTFRRSANDQTCTVITLGNRDVHLLCNTIQLRTPTLHPI